MEIETLSGEKEMQNNNMSHQHDNSQQGDSEHMEEERNFHVLAVDDSSIDRKILEKILAVSSNYHVTLLESGDKALEYLGLNDDSSRDHSRIDPSLEQSTEIEVQEEGNIGTRVHLIMTDYSMPGMTGYDLLKPIKGSAWKDVPVVIMSSENVPSRINMCMDEGAEEFLLKPLRRSDLKRLQFYRVKSSNCRSSIPNSCSDNTNNIDKTNKGIEDPSHDDSSGNKKVMVPETIEVRTKFEVGVVALSIDGE